MSLRLTSVAFAAKGDNNPKAAGATNKRWNNFIKVSSHNYGNPKVM